MADVAFRRLTGLDEPELAEILALVAGTDIVELEIVHGRSRIVIKHDVGKPPAAPVPAPTVDGDRLADNRRAITSPLVGIFHPSVAVQSHVTQGQPLGAIEAMGVPTSIDSPQAGLVEELLVNDGQPVEFGQPLLVIRPDRAGES